MGFFSVSSLFPVIFFVAFVIVLIIILTSVIRMAGMSKKNASQPKIAAPARVVAHRVFTSYGAGRNHISQNMYFMTFEFSTGDKAEYSVTPDAYSYFADGDEGTITVQGTRFISFSI